MYALSHACGTAAVRLLSSGGGISTSRVLPGPQTMAENDCRAAVMLELAAIASPDVAFTVLIHRSNLRVLIYHWNFTKCDWLVGL